MGVFHVANNLRGQVRERMQEDRVYAALLCDFTGPGFANVFLIEQSSLSFQRSNKTLQYVWIVMYNKAAWGLLLMKHIFT